MRLPTLAVYSVDTCNYNTALEWKQNVLCKQAEKNSSLIHIVIGVVEGLSQTVSTLHPLPKDGKISNFSLFTAKKKCISERARLKFEEKLLYILYITFYTALYSIKINVCIISSSYNHNQCLQTQQNTRPVCSFLER